MTYVSPLQRQVEQYLNLINQGVPQAQALATVGTTFAQLSAAGIDLSTPADQAATIAAADLQLDTYRAQQLAAARDGRPEPPPPPNYSLPGQTTVGDNLGLTPAQQAAARADPLGLNLTTSPGPLPAAPVDNSALLTVSNTPVAVPPAPVDNRTLLTVSNTPVAVPPAPVDNRTLLTVGNTPVAVPAAPVDNRGFLTAGVNATAPPVADTDFNTSLLAPGPGAIITSAEPLPTGRGTLSAAELQSGVIARTFEANANYQEVQFNNAERRRIVEDYQRRGLSSAEAFEDPRYKALTQDANRLIDQANAGTTVVPVSEYDSSTSLRRDFPVISTPEDKTRTSTEVSDSSGYAGIGDAEPAAPRSTQAQPVTGNLSAAFDVETQSWGVWDNNSGRFVQSGLSESDASSNAAFYSSTIVPRSEPRPVEQAPFNGTFSATFDPDSDSWGVWNDQTGAFVVTGLTQSQAQRDANEFTGGDFRPNPPIVNPVQTQASAAQAGGEQQQATLALARQQQSIREQRGQQNQGDWRVKLRLAPGANYLYKSNDPGILWPLIETDGVIFPYTPRIDTSYRADYDAINLIHSNYRGYFYKSSYVDFVQVSGTFTAQDTMEAEYLLAVITFFKSLTKMFYGQDAQRGSPPPLVYLTGLGEYQFSEHPCVVTQFNYNLPDNVDYIRARQAVVNATNLITKRNRNSTPSNPISSAIQRLKTLGRGVKPGAVNSPPPPPTLGINNPTYVPTKIDISLQLLPMQSRQQVSEQFSLNNFANGNLIKGGFW